MRLDQGAMNGPVHASQTPHDCYPNGASLVARAGGRTGAGGARRRGG